MSIERTREEQTVTVGAASPADHDRVGELAVAAYGAGQALNEEYAEGLRAVGRRVSEGTTVLAAWFGTQMVGTITVAPAGSPWADIAVAGEAEARMLAVLPSARGRGVGEALMRGAAEHARKAGARALVLCVVSTDGPGVAHRLYERLGFRRVPERDFTGWWEGEPTMWTYVLDL